MKITENTEIIESEPGVCPVCGEELLYIHMDMQDDFMFKSILHQGIVHFVGCSDHDKCEYTGYELYDVTYFGITNIESNES